MTINNQEVERVEFGQDGKKYAVFVNGIPLGQHLSQKDAKIVSQWLNIVKSQEVENGQDELPW